jgi:hypothetical protein
MAAALAEHLARPDTFVVYARCSRPGRKQA